MARTNPEARLRLVTTAADMLRRRGLNATSIRELAKAANAPLGSTYHYFPGGKQQVVSEALQYAGDKVTGMLGKALEQGPREGLNTFLGYWRGVIKSTDFRAGCPVIAVAMEDAADEEAKAAQAVAATIFERWEALLKQSLMDHGVAELQAEELATMIVASAEGALALCRAKKDIQPFDQVSAVLNRMVNAGIGDA